MSDLPISSSSITCANGGTLRLERPIAKTESGGVFRALYSRGSKNQKVIVRLLEGLSHSEVSVLETNLVAAQRLARSSEYLLRYLEWGTYRINELEGLFIAMEETEEDLLSYSVKNVIDIQEIHSIAFAILSAIKDLRSNKHVHKRLHQGNIFRVGGRWKVGDIVSAIDPYELHSLIHSKHSKCTPSENSPKHMQLKPDLHALAAITVYCLSGGSCYSLRLLRRQNKKLYRNIARSRIGQRLITLVCFIDKKADPSKEVDDLIRILSSGSSVNRFQIGPTVFALWLEYVYLLHNLREGVVSRHLVRAVGFAAATVMATIITYYINDALTKHVAMPEQRLSETIDLNRRKVANPPKRNPGPTEANGDAVPVY